MATAKDLIDQARVRHSAFLDVRMPDGALILYLNQRQRSLLLRYGQQVEAILTTSVELASVIGGVLVGQVGGVPYYTSTYADGWPVKNTGGVPYVNFSEIPIALDPFGERGGTPGFPLPDGFIKMTAATATLSDGRVVKIDVVPEAERQSQPHQGRPMAFVSGNRLVPMRDPTQKTIDAWYLVTKVALSYVGLKTVTTLTQTIDMPAVIQEALVAGLAELLAMSSTDLSDSETRLFVKERERTESDIEDAGNGILGDVASRVVQYRG